MGSTPRCNLELYPLKVFLTVAGEKSFSRAAEKLHRTALAEYRELVKGQPRDPDFRFSLCGCLNNLADLLRATVGNGSSKV